MRNGTETPLKFHSPAVKSRQKVLVRGVSGFATGQLTAVKLIIGTVIALATAGIATGVGYIALVGNGGQGQPPKPRYTTQAALLGATPIRAADALREHGHDLTGPLVCRDLPGVTARRLRLTCAGTTTTRRNVQVIAAADVSRRAEYYTILVGGRPLVQNVTCLGADCHRKRSTD